ncbi:electron transfer flavoprotein subunit beta [Spirochaetia bacterium]|nr:electron transfer flavoprotein subunit beta [Spirochaetia bacterium]
MNIIVPIKQVPESSNVKMDSETGTILRTGVESVINPLDLYALETALRIREEQGGSIHALTMGPLQARQVLKEAIAMGCDNGVLISDRAFGGADTWATSYTISQGIKKIGAFDLIITGERATDGDTAQVGPGIAAWLGIPVLSYVSKIEQIKGGRIVVERLIEEGYQKTEAALPCLLTVLKEIAQPRLPTLKGKIVSMEAEIPVFDSLNMDVDPSRLGLKGSPTRVTRIESPRVSRNALVYPAGNEADMAKALEALTSLLESRGVI